MFNFIFMDTLLKSLVTISHKLNDISVRLRYEEKVCTEELNHANSLGLDGSERILHYNNWMRKAGLDYLCVDE